MLRREKHAGHCNFPILYHHLWFPNWTVIPSSGLDKSLYCHSGIYLLPHFLHVCAFGPAVGKKSKPLFHFALTSASLWLMLCFGFMCSAVVLQCKKSLVSSSVFVRCQLLIWMRWKKVSCLLSLLFSFELSSAFLKLSRLQGVNMLKMIIDKIWDLKSLCQINHSYPR